MKKISNTEMKDSGPIVAPLIFSLTTAHSADLTEPYFGQKSPGILSLNHRRAARILKVSPPA
jgi:hypothetical protein